MVSVIGSIEDNSSVRAIRFVPNIYHNMILGRAVSARATHVKSETNNNNIIIISSGRRASCCYRKTCRWIGIVRASRCGSNVHEYFILNAIRMLYESFLRGRAIDKKPAQVYRVQTNKRKNISLSFMRLLWRWIIFIFRNVLTAIFYRNVTRFNVIWAFHIYTKVCSRTKTIELWKRIHHGKINTLFASFGN